MMYLRNSTIVSLIFFLVLSSCSDTSSIVDSNSDGDTSNPPGSEEVTLSFQSDSSSFLPGELIIIQAEGIELEKDEYQALLGDDIEVTLKRNESSDDELIFLVPEIGVGSHSLSLKNVETLNELEFSVREYKVIENPEMYITDIIDEIIIDLESIRYEAIDNSFKEIIDGQINDINEYKNELSERPADEIKLLARAIETHLVSFSNKSTGGNLTLESASIECEDPVKGIIVDIGFVSASIYALSLSGTVASTGWGAYVGGAVAVLSTGTLYGSLKLLKRDLSNFWDRCINESVEATKTWFVEIDTSSTRKNRNEQLSFAPGEKRAFYIYSEYEAPSQIQSSLDRLKSLLQTLPQVIPDSWMNVINHDYIFENKEDPSNFSIEEISSENIEAQVQTQDSLLVLEFKYVDDVFVSKDNEFSFNLRSETGIDITFEAVLAAPPEEFSAVINGELWETSYIKAGKTNSSTRNEVYISGSKEKYKKGEIIHVYFYINQPEFSVGSYQSIPSSGPDDFGSGHNMCISFALSDGSLEEPSTNTPRCSLGNNEDGVAGAVNITSVQDGIVRGDFRVTIYDYNIYGDILHKYVITEGQFKAYLED